MNERHYIGYVTPNSVKPLYLTIGKANEYNEQSNENKCLTIVPTDERKETLEKYEEQWKKTEHLIKSTSNNSSE